MSSPLAGVRVLDLTRLLPGGYATLLLADLGADVLKIEQPGVGDGLRAAAPYGSDGVSAAHAWLNRGKRSMTLDLKTAEGAQILHELLAASDVLIDSFRPGVLERLGLEPGTVSRLNPRLVQVSITFRGRRGLPAAVATRAGHDINAQALAGLLARAETGPVADGGQQSREAPAVQAADHVVGLHAALAVLSMLRVSERTGRGAFCDLAMTDAAYSMLGLSAAGRLYADAAPGEHQMLTGGLACYGLYTCADGRQLAVGALEPVFFQRLLHALGLDEGRAQEQYVPEAQPGLRAELAARLLSRDRDDWVDALAEVDCCVTPVRDVAEALADPVALTRGVVESAGPLGRLGPVFRWLGDPADASAVAGGRAPDLGEHTDSVLAELGRSLGDVAALRERGVV